MGGGVRSSARLSGAAAPARVAPAAGVAEARMTAAGVHEARALAAERRARAAERAREVEDSPSVLRDKCRRLARALRNAKHLVVYTGAGISTAADIPDYRGPRGVWTRLQRGETVGRVEVSRARPTFTHMALTALWARGLLKFVVSQNCDGLHVRAGLPRRALAELHGDMYCELCAACRRVYLRAFDTTERTARHAHGTRRLCHGCGRELRDSIVHFGERGRARWPLNWAGALRHAAAADVVLCLGSSLKVLRRYSRLWRMQCAPHARPALYIVNLQWTPKDAAAALKINARCDAVMAQVARRLRLRVPRYRARSDPLLAHAVPLAPPERHTTRRPHLHLSDSSDATSAPSSPSSPSPSPSSDSGDSDDEVPLRRLAERLRGDQRAPAPAPSPTPTPAPAPSRLYSFQVSLRTGEATILLRAEHAPGDLPPPEPPPQPPAPRTTTGDLRRVRIQRFLDRTGACNGSGGPANGGGVATLEPKVEVKKEDISTNGGWTGDSKLRQLLEMRPWVGGGTVKDEVKEEEASASALAAAIIRRAVLVCRASLYPGLHSMLPAGAGAGASADGAGAARHCAWCLWRHGARRCLWYGAPRDPAAPRAVRRARGRRYLCACCPLADPAASPAPAAPPADLVDDAGWFGKGYRKGRRRRR